MEEHEEWSIYEVTCRSCGKPILHIVTVASVELGYAEGLDDDLCRVCKAVQALSKN